MKNYVLDLENFIAESYIIEKESQHTKKFKKKYGDIDTGKGRDSFTSAVSKETGISKSILDDVYDRGIGAAKSTGTRASVNSDEQWARARVYSFVTKGSGTFGKADKDLAEKIPDDIKKKL